jgi:hypothetical protein
LNPYVPATLRELVISRAHDRCEYCGLSQVGQEAAFHIDHVVPLAAGGLTNEHNLALACVSCSLLKGARELVEDPETGTQVSIFNPRSQAWEDHFRWDGVVISGTTMIGRATVAALQLNRPLILAIRAEEVVFGRHPPPSRHAK